MHEAILVIQFLVCEKTPAGLVTTYNNTGKHAKTIIGVSEADCIEKVEEFLKENDFKSLKDRR